MIYFIGADDGKDGVIKIGRSRNAVRRFVELSRATATWSPLTLFAIIPGGRAEEVALHWYFQHLRVKGEWFSGAPDLWALIRREQAAHAVYAQGVLDANQEAIDAYNRPRRQRRTA